VRQCVCGGRLAAVELVLTACFSQAQTAVSPPHSLCPSHEYVNLALAPCPPFSNACKHDWRWHERQRSPNNGQRSAARASLRLPRPSSDPLIRMARRQSDEQQFRAHAAAVCHTCSATVLKLPVYDV
jgi:hypothetical protein